MVDEKGAVVNSFYQFHRGAIADTLRSMLGTIDISCIGGIAMTESGPDILQDVPRYDTQIAMIAAVKKYHTEVGSILFVGGENFGLITFNKQGDYERFRSNSSCAAGTGSFLDQQAKRLNLKSIDDDFVRDIEQFKIIVTYNGRCFDVPFIEKHFSIRMNHVHIDLRFLLKSLGFSGGLKGCERQLGIDRGDLSDIDGYYAVILWNDYRRTGNEKKLKLLLDYNSADAKNLETLLVKAYNMNLKNTPFYESNKIM